MVSNNYISASLNAPIKKVGTIRLDVKEKRLILPARNPLEIHSCKQVKCKWMEEDT